MQGCYRQLQKMLVVAFPKVCPIRIPFCATCSTLAHETPHHSSSNCSSALDSEVVCVIQGKQQQKNN